MEIDLNEDTPEFVADGGHRAGLRGERGEAGAGQHPAYRVSLSGGSWLRVRRSVAAPPAKFSAVFSQPAIGVTFVAVSTLRCQPHPKVNFSFSKNKRRAIGEDGSRRGRRCKQQQRSVIASTVGTAALYHFPGLLLLLALLLPAKCLVPCLGSGRTVPPSDHDNAPLLTFAINLHAGAGGDPSMELEHAIGFAGKLRGCCPPSPL